ncbi:MAG: hypothetical protein LBF88_14780 [Planctomycetaceae bacterium]|jgi:hypothetical protein|nr:hypothetical protein [Planctomycetaceae bacterium]
MKFFLTFHILLFVPIVCSGWAIGQIGQHVAELLPSKTRELTIPFEVRPDRSADPIKEVELLYSQNRGVHWLLSDRKPVESGKFGFKTEIDGEYWFAFRTVTLSGVKKKSSVNTPIRVLIDATPPKLSLETKQLDSGELLVVWKAEDQHLQMKRPDFAVSITSNNSGMNSDSSDHLSEKNWNPLNIDGQNIRVLDSGLEGSFRFLPESGVSQLELRASIRDFVGNRVEKTSSITIKPVQNEKIPQADSPVMSAKNAIQNAIQNTIQKSDPTPIILNSSTSTSTSSPLTPPKPIRMHRQKKNNHPAENKSLQKSDAENQPKRENLLENIQETNKNDTDKNNADKTDRDENNTDKTDLPIPILVSPDGKVAENFEQSREYQPVSPNRSDKITEELLANMGAFFDGGLPVEVTKTIPKMPATVHSAEKQSDVPQSAVADSMIRPPVIPPTAMKLPVAGSITEVTLNAISTQPQIIVKWNIGDAPWQESQIDVLRGSTIRGPWQPIAINLRNNGEYWWYLSSLDLNPFFIMVRIRSFQSGVASDVTELPIEINPTLLKQSSLR